MPMVKEEPDRSRSPMSRDHKRRRNEHSSSQHTHRHRHRHNDRESSSSGSPSSSPGSHERRRKKHSHRHHERHRHERREERESQGDSHRRIKQEPVDNFRVKQEPADPFEDQRRERQHNDDRRREMRRQREQNGGSNFAQPSASEEAAGSAKEKEKPNFELSGKLTEDTNTFRGVVVKYNEPAEARKPKRRWRLYGFKGDEALPMLPIHRQSAYLLGRDRRVADIPVDHPSCSKQHAVLQYRLTEFTRADGAIRRKVSPYIIDLGSANGTYVNNQRIESERYVELFERDLIKFGFSTREYVLLHEQADTTEVAQSSESE